MTNASERRITHRLMSYWRACKGDKMLPLAEDIKQGALKDVWDDCFIVEVNMKATPGEEFRYSYIGPSIIAAYGDETTGADIQTALMSPSGSHIADIYYTVIEKKEPMVDESEFKNLRQTLIRYRQCVTPFGDEKGNVTRLLGGMRWGVF